MQKEQIIIDLRLKQVDVNDFLYAFGKLYAPMIAKYAFYDDAEQLFLIGAYKAIFTADFSKTGDCFGYLAQNGRFEITNTINKGRSVKKEHLFYIDGADLFDMQDNADMERDVILREAIKRAVEKLTDNQLEVFNLLVQGYTVTEISRMTDRCRSCTDKLVQKIRKKLTEELEEGAVA